MHAFMRGRSVAVLLLLFGLAGCATLRGFLALGEVSFSLDRISSVQLAGVDLARFRSYEDLGAADAARVFQAITAGRMPLSFLLHVSAENPEENPEARLFALDWTLFLEERETVSGGLPEPLVIGPGATGNVPLEIRLDLLEFFDGNARELVNLALSLAEGDAPPPHVHLVATPAVDTPLGPISYPRPITILRR